MSDAVPPQPPPSGQPSSGLPPVPPAPTPAPVPPSPTADPAYLSPAFAPPAYGGPPATPEPAVLRPLRGIGAATRWLVAATAMMSLVTIAVDASGLSAIDAFVAGTAGIDALDAYDRASQPAALAWSAVYIAAAVCWLIWQYRAARSIDPMYLRRTPGWHVGFWFIPFANWWWPFQNMKDLVWGSRAAVKPVVLGVWWALWLVANLVAVFSNRQLMAAETPESFSAALSFSILGDALLIATAAFAWIVVKRITDALDPAAR